MSHLQLPDISKKLKEDLMNGPFHFSLWTLHRIALDLLYKQFKVGLRLKAESLPSTAADVCVRERTRLCVFDSDTGCRVRSPELMGEDGARDVCDVICVCFYVS